MFVYIENAHNISSYTPIFNYNGDSIDELVNEVKNYLQIPDKSKINVTIYDKRFGYISRHLLTSLSKDYEDVYIKLRVEDGN